MLRMWLLGLLLFIAPTLFAQKYDDLLGRAQLLYQNGKFEEALQLMRTAPNSRGVPEVQFFQALCHYQVNQLDQALSLLEDLVRDRRSNFSEAYHYLGLIYHDRHQFEEATGHFKNYLRTLRPGHPDRAMVIEKIRRCDNGQRLKFRDNRVVVENLGPQVNGPGDEFGPVISPNSSGKLYFTAVRSDNVGGMRNAYNEPDPILGSARSDIYSTKLMGTTWSAAQPMHHLLNSPRHEIVLDFNQSGRKLYFFQGWDMASGDYLVDTFQEGTVRQLQTVPLVSPLDIRQGDGTPCFFNDTLIIFSSRRPGGQGGLDLWETRRIRNTGRWSVPRNLGPRINSAYDETTPFLSIDGRTLYFSTNDSERSMGGFDIVKSFYVEGTGQWTLAENIGLPINSAADDTHFRLARDGFTGFLASSRRDGYGQRDLYVVYYQDFQQEMEPVFSFRREEPEVQAPVVTRPTPAPPPQTQPSTPTPAEPAPVRTAPTEPTVPTLPKATAFVIPFPGLQLPSDGATSFQLEEALKALNNNLDLRMVVTAYSPTETSAALFNGIKRTEEVANYLIAHGANPGRLSLRSVAHKGTPSQVLLNFTHAPGIGISSELPVIGKNAPLFQESPHNQMFYYKVQVVSTRKQAYQNDRLLDLFGHPMVETLPGFEYYRYTVGAVRTFQDAEALRKRLQQNGISGAFIVPYYQGRRVNSGEITMLSRTFPDLQAYRR